MDAEIKRKWVEALRSGKYRQGQKQLRFRDHDGEDAYCCLGVLCDLIAPDQWKASSQTLSFNHEGAVSMPPSSVRKSACLSKAEADELAALNDNGMSFIAIADTIEANL